MMTYYWMNTYSRKCVRIRVYNADNLIKHGDSRDIITFDVSVLARGVVHYLGSGKREDSVEWHVTKRQTLSRSEALAQETSVCKQNDCFILCRTFPVLLGVDGLPIKEEDVKDVE